MSSPCGKCNTCPCGTNGSCGTNGGAAQQPPPEPPQQQQQQQQPQSCPDPDHCDLRKGPSTNPQQQPQVSSGGGCQVNVYQPPPPSQQQYQPTQRPHVDCTCTQNRQRNRGTAIQAPLADNYTCSRPPRVAAAPPPAVETRCNCHEKPKKIECQCAPPVAPTVSPPNRYETQPTHANVTCGQAAYPQGPPPYVRRTNNSQCGHCRSQRKRNRSSAALGRKRPLAQTQNRRVAFNRGRRYHDGRPRIHRSYSESVLANDRHRNSGRNRGRHCFVYKSARPVEDDFPCCCPQPPRLTRQLAPLPCPYSIPAPVPRSPPPIGSPECCCSPQTSGKPTKRYCCTSTKKACCFNGPNLGEASPGNFQPADTSINGGCEDPFDAYSRNDACHPGVNFDLQRYDRDTMGNGRRRNVSIRTCVDYEYEPGPGSIQEGRRAAFRPSAVPNVDLARYRPSAPLPRAIAAPVYVPNYPPGPESRDCYEPRSVQSDTSLLRNRCVRGQRNNFEYDFFDCPNR